MLADGDALRETLGIIHSDEKLKINVPASVIEERSETKEMLDYILKLANSSSRYSLKRSDIEPALANVINLSKLCPMKSFRLFLDSLKTGLNKITAIEEDCEQVICR